MCQTSASGIRSSTPVGHPQPGAEDRHDPDRVGQDAGRAPGRAGSSPRPARVGRSAVASWASSIGQAPDQAAELGRAAVAVDRERRELVLDDRVGRREDQRHAHLPRIGPRRRSRVRLGPAESRPSRQMVHRRPAGSSRLFRDFSTGRRPGPARLVRGRPISRTLGIDRPGTDSGPTPPVDPEDRDRHDGRPVRRARQRVAGERDPGPVGRARAS